MKKKPPLSLLYPSSACLGCLWYGDVLFGGAVEIVCMLVLCTPQRTNIAFRSERDEKEEDPSAG